MIPAQVAEKILENLTQMGATECSMEALDMETKEDKPWRK